MTYRTCPTVPLFRGRVWIACMVSLGALLYGFSDASPEMPEKPYFSIPEGKAHKTLNLAAQQAKVNLIVLRNTTQDITTGPLEGHYEVEEAFRRLLEGTPLTIVRSKRSKAYTVVPKPPPPSISESISKPQNELDIDTEMKELRTLIKKLAAVSSTAAIASSPQGALGQDEDEQDVFELSPFMVTSDDDQGYRATSTLAGTRLKTDVSDLGSSISIVTERFMDDVAGTDADSLLSYVANVEVGGPLGNISGADFSPAGGFQSIDSNSAKGSSTTSRVRGLVEAELTRNYFRTSIPFDSYNTSSVTINRGPNSVLFGLGSPGGVIENSLITPSLDNNFGEVEVRLDARGGNRVSIDVNRSILEDRLAVRVALLQEDKKFRQSPAFEEDNRLFGAFNWTIAKNENTEWLGRTTLRGSYETGRIDSNPPDVLPPNDGFSDWWTGIDLEGMTAIPTFEDLLRNGGGPWRWRIPVENGGTWVPKGRIAMRSISSIGVDGVNTLAHPLLFTTPAVIYPDARSSTPNAGVGDIGEIYGRIIPETGGRYDWYASLDSESRFPGFLTPSLTNRNVFDFVNHKLSGFDEYFNQDFDAQQISLEQQFLNGNAGLEVTFNQEDYSDEQYLPYGGGGVAGQGSIVYLDMNDLSHVPTEFPSDDPNPVLPPNPNFLRPFLFNWNLPFVESETERETLRATAFYRYDFANANEGLGKWLGSHTLTGLYEDTTTDSFGRSIRRTRDARDPATKAAIGGDRLTTVNHILRTIRYIGDPVGDLSDPGQVRLQQNTAGRPELGTSWQGIFWSNGEKRSYVSEMFYIDTLIDGSAGRDELKSDAYILQSNWLDDHLVTLFASRTDEITNFEENTAVDRNLPDGTINPDYLTIGSDPVSSEEGTTETFSVVARFPEKYLFELPGNTDLQFHYFESESFQPGGLRRNVLGELIAAPTGTTEEYGFTIDFMDRKLSLRANWYETSSANNSTGLNGAVGQLINLPGFLLRNYKEAELAGWTFDNELAYMKTLGFNNYEEAYTAFRNILPEPTRTQVANYRFPAPDTSAEVETNNLGGLTSTFDFISEGMEIELIGAINENWNVVFSIAQQETVRGNTGNEFQAVAQAALQNLASLNLDGVFSGNPLFEPETLNDGSDKMYPEFFDERVLLPFRNEKAADGEQSVEQREWRWNAVTTYSFREGALKGFTFGGSARWEDSAAIGYPLILNADDQLVSDVKNPFYGNEEFYADAWVTYERELTDKVDWKVQFNVRNLVGGDADNFIPIRINPLGDVQNVRLGPERQFILTNTFSF